MKNFTRLLMAVVLLASYSCVQDTTEDLAPVISDPTGESGEVNTLCVSMPTSSRTALGEEVDGKFPVYWCEEDVLAVNGKPTTGIRIDEEKPNVAVFELPLGIKVPYNIVYPYQGEGVVVNAEDGKYPVVFASEQMHTSGTFAQDSAPMFAWSNGFDEIRMEHLATALCFRIKAAAGKEVKLRYISVSTVDAEPISGEFDVYCSDSGDVIAGTLEPRSSAISTVFYNFPDDEFILTDKTKAFYIAVPRGSYSRFEVNFVNTDGEVFVETFDAADDKKLVGGKVRQFPVVEFEANSKMLLIGNDKDMETFAAAVKSGSFNDKYDGALLVNDIDMTDKPWTSIEGFDSVLEGRNYTIKGLTTPLFGENVTATISNVSVEGNIVEEKNGKVGLIARSLAVSGDKAGSLFNCSATGSIVYKNPGLKVSGEFDLINIGGLVGGVYGGSVTLSNSDVAIKIETAGPIEEASDYNPCIGGVIGYMCANGDTLPVVSKNTNNGVIVWDDNSKGKQVTPFIGGVAGYATAGTFAENVNSGELSINEAMYDLDWGGVIGATAASISGCENKGSLYINEAVTKANIGGVLGKLEVGSIENCENSGKLLFDEKFEINGSCTIGGVVAYAMKGTKSIADCSNSGSITYLGSCKYSRDLVVGNANIILGGVVGLGWSESIRDCNNATSAVIRVAGKVSGNGDLKSYNLAAPEKGGSIDQMTAIAGVVGIRGGKQADLKSEAPITIENCSNSGNVTFTWQYCGSSYIFSSACIGVFDSDRAVSCKNEGLVEMSAKVSSDTVAHETTKTMIVFASGMFGCISSSCDDIHNCENVGSVRVFDSESLMLWVSGLLGTAMSGVNIKFTQCGNTGNIIVEESVVARNVYVGGILASTFDIKLQYPQCYNSGRVESKAVATSETFVGSIFGLSTGSDTGAGTEGIQNTGRVVYSGNSALVYLGGYCGLYNESSHTVEFNNANTGLVEFKGVATLKAFIGGIAGIGCKEVKPVLSSGVATAVSSISQLSSGGEFVKGMVNNGEVTITGYAPEVYIAGGFGYFATGNKGVSGLTNSGDIKVPADETADILPTTIHMGGVFGYASMSATRPTTSGSIKETSTLRNCHNTGHIIYSGIARDGAYIGGVVGRASTAPIYKCTNTGEVVSTGHAGDASPKLTQSVEKNQHNGFAFNYKNHDLAVGGIVGETDLDIAQSVNEGAVTHTCTLNPLKVDHNGNRSSSRFDVGGIAGRTFVPHAVGKSKYALTLSALTNNGAVTIYGEPSATNNTPSVDLADNGEWQWTDVDDADRLNLRLFYRVNVAGLVGRMMDNSSANVENYVVNCTNNAKVSVPEAAGAKCLSIAGAVGELLVSHAAFTSVKNTGKISIDKAGVGTVVSGAQFMHTYYINLAGIVGTYFDSRIFQYSGNCHQKVHFNDCENTGDVHYGETAASVYQCAGGIMGQVLHFVRDYCIGSPNAPEGESYTGSSTRYSCVEVNFNRCKNSGNIDYLSTAMNLSSGYNFNYAGGILGTGNMGHDSWKQTYGAVDLNFDHCENSGSIQFDRNNGAMSTNASPAYTAVGGIVGHYCGGNGYATEKTSHSYSGKGTITTKNGYKATITSCKNSGRIWGYSGYVGGIIGCGSWFVTITGTEADPTINTGDIVVKRENGKVVSRNRYGNKVIYAGGIAGIMREYTNAAYAVGNASGNPAYPPYQPEDQCCRIEYAVNEGAVGATGYAGGIAGYYYSAVAASRELKNAISKGGMEFCRSTGDVYALEGATVNVGALVGIPRMLTYTSSDANDLAVELSSRSWPIGVRNCYISGKLLRGALGQITIDETNYMDSIYGENWMNEEFESIVSGKPYDGCILYVPVEPETPETPETPENPEGGEGDEGAETAAKR